MPEPRTSSGCGIVVAMRTRQTHRRELIQTLESLKSRVNQGDLECECEFYEDLSEPNRYLWCEWWPDPQLCKTARESDRFRALLGAIRVLGTLDSVRTVERMSNETQSQLNKMTGAC